MCCSSLLRLICWCISVYFEWTGCGPNCDKEKMLSSLQCDWLWSNLTWLRKLQIVRSQGWNILSVWGNTRQSGEPEAAVRACKICKWGAFDDWGIQDAPWSSTLPSKPCCGTPWRKLCLHCLWQDHFYFICGHCELPTTYALIAPYFTHQVTSKLALSWQDQYGKVPLYWGITADGYVAFANDADLLKGACGKSLASFPQGKIF